MTQQTAAATWSATLGQLEMLVTRANFDTWLRDTVGLRHEHGRFVVGAQNDFATEWLGVRLRPIITRTLARVIGTAIDVVFEVARLHEDASPLLLPAEEHDAAPATVRRHTPAPPALNPALTFESFVVGEENRLAFEAARTACERPGTCNPLVIFGASGLGKTHLLSAIGHASHAAGRAVQYATAERFGNDFVQSLGKSIDAFRSKYRGCDVLLIDDVQFLEGKEKFQEEFFHAFNDLHAMGKQVVISADRAPALISGLGEALRSRLSWGLAADLHLPLYETRLAILRAKAGRQALHLSEDALQTIAERCCPSVRELEGYLNRVIAYVPLVGGVATRDAVERALSPFDGPRAAPQPPSPETIIDAVCRRTGATPAELRGRSRNRDVTYARHLAMYLLKEDAARPVSEIGRLFGNRDHSTVLGAIDRIGKEQRVREETAADLRAVRELACAATAALRAVV